MTFVEETDAGTPTSGSNAYLNKAQVEAVAQGAGGPTPNAFLVEFDFTKLESTFARLQA